MSDSNTDEKCLFREIEILRPMPGDILVVHVDVGADDGTSAYHERIGMIQDKLQNKFPELKLLVAPMGFAKFEVIRPSDKE